LQLVVSWQPTWGDGYHSSMVYSLILPSNPPFENENTLSSSYLTSPLGYFLDHVANLLTGNCHSNAFYLKYSATLKDVDAILLLEKWTSSISQLSSRSTGNATLKNDDTILRLRKGHQMDAFRSLHFLHHEVK